MVGGSAPARRRQHVRAIDRQAMAQLLTASTLHARAVPVAGVAAVISPACSVQSRRRLLTRFAEAEGGARARQKKVHEPKEATGMTRAQA